ncbi:MAG: sulfur carrier protein ThiS [Bacteroidales bacterium]|jgi:thiamine biosynthesis protein ThiS|nr:sulfur carrier protein ThiS [Bacteroidales bacterium]
MKITLNHQLEEFDAEILTINELLKIKNFTFKMLVIKINGKIIRKHEYDTATVKDGDDVIVLHLITGG